MKTIFLPQNFKLCLILLLLNSILSIKSAFSQGNTPILPGGNTNPYGICESPPPGCQEIPICTYYDDCFRFDFYAPKHKPDGTTVLKYKITNFSESTFKRATFELPGVGNNRTPAVLPTTKFRNRYNHDVINPFNGISIAYDAKNAGTFSYGGFEVYYYIVNTAEFNTNGKLITVTAEAGRSWQQQRSGSIIIDVEDCIPPGQEEFCIEQEDDRYKLGFPFWTQNAQGNIPMDFTLINKSADPIEYFEIEAATGSIIEPANGSTYNSPVATYTYNVTSNTTVLRYTASGGSTAGFVNGARDIFNFMVNAQAYLANGGLITARVKSINNALVSEFIFETAECGEIVPLPVELTSFTGVPSTNGINLKWVTASEKSNDHFDIERSADGKNFEKIGFQAGNGTTSNRSSYAFLDKDPNKGLNYYRLKQVDLDGTSEYSNIIQVNSEKGFVNLGVQLIPNPCSGQNCSVMLRGIDTQKQVLVTIQDLTGRTVFSKEIPNDQASFTLPKIAAGSGIYILSVKNGTSTAHQKVILQQ